MTKPLYQIIYEELKNKILAGELKVHEQLPTEYELSDIYGVSRITSKRALTELESEQLIYRKQGRGSFVAEQATTNRLSPSNKILFAIPFAHDLSVGNFYEGISPIIQESDYELLMIPSEFLDEKTATEVMNDYIGLVYYADKNDSHLSLLYSLQQANFPVVVLDQPIYNLNLPSVSSNNFKGGHLSASYLIEKGHTKIGYIIESHTPPNTVKERYLGYLDAINEHQIGYHTPYNSEESHLNHALNYIKKNQLTAVLCENDLVAIKLINQLKAANYLIPEEVAVIGFDNIQAASLLSPTLTTVAQNFKEIGELAGKKIIRLLADEPIENMHQLVDVQLIERESSSVTKNCN
ncbi:GntR family transcriptional regulator [Vagococcus zengguangii]|uniref:GntR family transcriptional regulator n=1 Tax=Vagococcus zengguangii TaxID=2571750 RepID=A0A4D7CVD2_9ENTE|nr:substrate-binding domain-containing protein [Vagococcus zengguangii]QCI86210.1 GntR family transcriptional regulator [Vagococcus zengguangii]